jgi:hypothetical protein
MDATTVAIDLAKAVFQWGRRCTAAIIEHLTGAAYGLA